MPPGETLDRGLPILCRDGHAGAADGSAVSGHEPTWLPRRVRSHLTTAVPLTDPPARYRAGPWPVPHDTILDFTSTPAGYGWLDELAAAAADRAGSVAGPTVIGHSDWYARNLRLADGSRGRRLRLGQRHRGHRTSDRRLVHHRQRHGPGRADSG